MTAPPPPSGTGLSRPGPLLQPSATYAKPARTPQDLLAHVVARGLTVRDPLAALRALERTGYYRLLIYMRALQSPATAGAAKCFNPGTTFEQIVALYDFDRELRLHCLDAIERIEVALRAAINNTLGVALGPHFYADRSHFEARFDHSKMMWKIRRAEGLGVTHYKRTYAVPPYPPIWVVLEAASYGVLSQMFSGLTLQHRKAVARCFTLGERVLVSWFRSLNQLRNICAHHNRLWNAGLLVDKPMVAKPYAGEFSSTSTVYARLVVLAILLRDVDLAHVRWNQGLKALFIKHPLVDPTALGCPSDWEKRKIWA